LRGADLRNANLNRTKLQNSKLQGAKSNDPVIQQMILKQEKLWLLLQAQQSVGSVLNREGGFPTELITEIGKLL
jgi:uncharacterized protein YjbI with pentapeptide repeats